MMDTLIKQNPDVFGSQTAEDVMKNMANDSGAGELLLQKLNETKPEVFGDPKKLKRCMGGLMMKQKLKQELKNQVRNVFSQLKYFQKF